MLYPTYLFITFDQQTSTRHRSTVIPTPDQHKKISPRSSNKSPLQFHHNHRPLSLKMSTMDVSKLSANQLKQMKVDKRRVVLLYRKDDRHEVQRIPNDISEPLIRGFSTYCNLKLPVQSKSAGVAIQEKPSIIIQTEDIQAVRDILNWIMRYASGDRKLPSLGDKPLYNALMLNRTAELLGLPIIMLSEIKGAMKNFTSTYLSPQDVLAIAKSSLEASHDWKLAVDNTAQQVHDALMAGNSDKAGRTRTVISSVPGLVDAVRVALTTKHEEQVRKDAQKAAERRARRGPRAKRPDKFGNAASSAPCSK